jgi:hypothetical protein
VVSFFCVKTIGDKFKIPEVKFDGNTYTIDNVISIGLGKIYDAQTADGGFSYYKGLPSNLYLTINMVNTLKDLKEAGYNVDGRVLQTASNYISSTLLAKGIKHYGVDAFISGAYAITRGDDYSYTEGISEAILPSITKSFVNEKASSMTLGYLALLAEEDARFSPLLDRVFTALENRVDIDSRGAYVKSLS